MRSSCDEQSIPLVYTSAAMSADPKPGRPFRANIKDIKGDREAGEVINVQNCYGRDIYDVGRNGAATQKSIIRFPLVFFSVDLILTAPSISMPSLLSRFKRSSSISSSHSGGGDTRHSRSNTVSSQQSHTQPYEDGAALSPSRSPPLGHGGSNFVEDFGDVSASPSKQGIHRTPSVPLAIPATANKQVVGTPKLVLTEEGSNSPRSFDSIPVNPIQTSSRKGRSEGLGLGIAAGTEHSPEGAVSPVMVLMRELIDVMLG